MPNPCENIALRIGFEHDLEALPIRTKNCTSVLEHVHKGMSNRATSCPEGLQCVERTDDKKYVSQSLSLVHEPNFNVSGLSIVSRQVTSREVKSMHFRLCECAFFDIHGVNG